MTPAKETIEEVHFIVDPKGKVWKESTRVTHDECRNAFCKDWLAPIEQYVDSHTCWNIWGCFEKAGWKIECIKLNEVTK